jgi:hypothetical protein
MIILTALERNKILIIWIILSPGTLLGNLPTALGGNCLGKNLYPTAYLGTLLWWKLCLGPHTWDRLFKLLWTILTLLLGNLRIIPIGNYPLTPLPQPSLPYDMLPCLRNLSIRRRSQFAIRSKTLYGGPTTPISWINPRMINFTHPWKLPKVLFCVVDDVNELCVWGGYQLGKRSNWWDPA